MADNAETTTPGAHPDAVVINENGSVNTRNGKGFVWVHDEITGARYDVPARMLPRQGLRVVEGYPVNYQRDARAAKPAVLLGDLAPTAGRVVVADASVPVDSDLAAARTALAASTGTVAVPGLTPDVAGAEVGDLSGQTPGEQAEAGSDAGDQAETGDQKDTGDQSGDQADAGSTTTSTTTSRRSRSSATATKAGAAGSEAGTR